MIHHTLLRGQLDWVNRKDFLPKYTASANYVCVILLLLIFHHLGFSYLIVRLFTAHFQIHSASFISPY